MLGVEWVHWGCVVFVGVLCGICKGSCCLCGVGEDFVCGIVGD